MIIEKIKKDLENRFEILSWDKYGMLNPNAKSNEKLKECENDVISEISLQDINVNFQSYIGIHDRAIVISIILPNKDFTIPMNDIINKIMNKMNGIKFMNYYLISDNSKLSVKFLYEYK